MQYYEIIVRLEEDKNIDEFLQEFHECRLVVQGHLVPTLNIWLLREADDLPIDKTTFDGIKCHPSVKMAQYNHRILAR